MSDETTMVQASPKTPAGTLLNAKGHDEQSFAYALAILHDNVPAILALEQALKAGTVAADTFGLHPEQPVPTPPPVPAPPSPSSWGTAPKPTQSFQQAATPNCAHGFRTARTGSGAKGPWRGWFCPSPKGTPDQCKAIFVDRGTPEWNSFPA
jgi:hypothetical protein